MKLGRKPLILSVSTCLLVAAIVFASLPREEPGHNEEARNEDQAETHSNTADPVTSDEIRSIEQKNQQSLRSDPSQPASAVQVTITRKDPDGTVAAIINGVTSGTCTARYQKAEHSIEASAAIASGPSYFACQMKPSDFPTSGEWSLKVYVNSPQGAGESSAEVITIE